ncbi:hypothetical protein GDO81_022068 [Engystomops pustulosus]|uniref:Uncharacterized protein n=1 Tax=Engystomops pustulosus TaxID=76066 RepID=A0AAV6ZP56_ENGPU|nr:hypothetical protein GDO81_022068 [Engystomops pustulosus]
MKGDNSVWGGCSEGGLFSLTSLSVTTPPCLALWGPSPPLTTVMSPPRNAHLGWSVETSGDVVSLTLAWSVKHPLFPLYVNVRVPPPHLQSSVLCYL